MKKGQFSFFIILAILLISLAAAAWYVLSQKNTWQPTGTVEEARNKEQAAEIIQECIADLENESFYSLGYYGGYVEFPYRDSFFEASPSLLTIEEMEDNFEAYLERNFRTCETLLDGQKFAVEWNRKPKIEVELANSVTIMIQSIGTVYQRDNPDLSGPLMDVNIEFAVNFPELYAIVEEQYTSDEWSIIEDYEGYAINNTVNANFIEQVFEIKHLATNFIFRITKGI